MPWGPEKSGCAAPLHAPPYRFRHAVPVFFLLVSSSTQSRNYGMFIDLFEEGMAAVFSEAEEVAVGFKIPHNHPGTLTPSA